MSTRPHTHRYFINEGKGITLIALIITIIVLLILAGVTISTLTGENGILTRAADAKTQTELARIEEEANLEYATQVLDRQGSSEGIRLKEDILDKINNVSVMSSGGDITGISLGSSNLIMDINGNATIKVTYEGSSGDGAYYVKVDGKCYKVELNDLGIKIARTPTKIESSSDVLSASSNSNTVTVGNISGAEIPLTSGTSGGTATITVKCGEYEKTCIVSVVKRPETGATASNSVPTFSTDYGLVDVIWLKDKTNNYTTEPNEPILNANGADDANKMTPVTWTKQSDETWKEDETASTSYYSYKSGNGTEDNLTSEWANAKNKDGSYFVWIPRFAYRITYYSDSEYTTVTGCWDGNGLYNAIDGMLNYENDTGIETTDGPRGKYIVHPAFGTCLDLGGWDNGGLEGFWVAKYEMSQETYSSSTNTWANSFSNTFTDGNKQTNSTIRARSVPNQKSWRWICVGTVYLNGYKYDREKESHLMKNSEWGAVALLTHSQYGRNGHEIDKNNSTSLITGNGGGSPSASSALGTTNAYNTITGAKASSTGNIYGIYDLSGGAWEYVAGFDALGSVKYVEGIDQGLNMTRNALNPDYEEGTSEEKDKYKSTKYITVYQNGTTDRNSKDKLFEVSKMGDATKEVRKQSSSYGWNDDGSSFVCTNQPFFYRGGQYSLWTTAGVFFANYCFGGYGNCGSDGFRAVLCP